MPFWHQAGKRDQNIGVTITEGKIWAHRDKVKAQCISDVKQGPLCMGIRRMK